MNFPKGVFSIPNLLCYYRVVFIPVMIWLIYLDHIWQDQHIWWPAWLNVFLYTLAGASDFLDGYIARKLKQETLLGKFLDSSTDKMIVGAALMALIAYQRLTGIWMVMSIIIMMREILIAGVREFMALYNVIVKISWMGKWKLAIQMGFTGFLIAGDYGDMLIPHAMLIGKIGFTVGFFLGIISGWEYLVAAWKTIRQLEAEGKT